MREWQDLVPASVLLNYELHNFNHAVEILSQAHAAEYMEIVTALDNFTISVTDLMSGGGNESAMPILLTNII